MVDSIFVEPFGRRDFARDDQLYRKEDISIWVEKTDL